MELRQLQHWLQLHLCPEVGSIHFLRLIKHFGSAERVLGASQQQLEQVPGIGRKRAVRIATERDAIDAAAEIERAGELGISFLTLNDNDYPLALSRIEDAPPVLYVHGQIRRKDSLAIGIVGARKCSRYGAEQAARFSGLLAGAGFTVVSGLAEGVDGYAHKAATDQPGRTIAVLGSGLERVFPKHHADLAGNVAENGAVITEYPLRGEPQAHNFPARNRIISGLSLGVLVVEADRRSGSLITARLAGEQGREVFALPGRVDSPYSRGTHALIQDGAKLVTCLEDIVDELGAIGRQLDLDDSGGNLANTSTVMVSLDDAEKDLLAHFHSTQLHIDELVELSDLPAPTVTSMLTQLQLKGVLRQSPGGYFAPRN